MPDESEDFAAPAEPLLEQKVAETVAPYAELLPPEVLEDFRLFLEDFAMTHPVMERLYRRLKPPPVVEKSGDLVRDGALAPNAEADRKAGGGG